MDNLKLGYGGTKEEMQRLLADASELAGVDFELSSYADVIEAIHVIQTDMGITGTTAAEAAQTISGSTAAMKAAWQNLLVGISDDTQDFDGLVDNLVNSVSTVADNVLPRIEVIFGGLGRLIEQLFPKIVEQIPVLVSEGLPKLASLAVTLIKTLVDGLKKNAKLIGTSAVDIITLLVNSVLEMLPDIVELGLELIIALAEGIADNIGMVVDTVADVVLRIAEMLTNPDTLLSLIDAGLKIIVALIDGITKALPKIAEAIPDIVKAIVKAIPIIIDAIIEALLAPDMITSLAQAGVDVFKALVSELPSIISAIVSAIPEIITSICSHFLSPEFLLEMAQTGVELIGELLSEFPSVVESALSIIDGIFGTHLAKWYQEVQDFFFDFGANIYEMTHGDLLSEQELHSKYSTLDYELDQAALDAIHGGASAEEAYKQAIREVLDTSEKLYAFQVLSEANTEGYRIDFALDRVEQWERNITAREIAQENLEANPEAWRSSPMLQGPQPLEVILQMPSGVEVGRQYIEDINTAKRADGVAY